MTTNEELYAQAEAHIPGGVNSPIRAFRAVGGTPYFVERAEGPRVWDVEGTEYLDLVQSYGAVIAGHAHPAIVSAIQEAATKGTSYGAPTEGEVRIAEEICARVPSVEKVRLVSSGTEATMSAIRLARGHTGRTKLVKFAGNYHGHGDALLAQSGSALAVFSLPESVGVTEATVADTIVIPFNEVPTLDDQVAAVILEPAAANMGLIPPEEGFLQALRDECDRVGALLIFDEVITGFRVARGGAQELYGVDADLTCFGKVIGGGLNIGAFGGRAEIMDSLAPDGPVFQAGTLSGNPLATAAGRAALDLLDDAAYDRLRAGATRLADGLAKAFADAGIDVVIPRVSSLVGLHLGDTAPRTYDDAKTTDVDRYRRFFHAMLRRGVAMAPGAYEVLFPGLAHTDDVIDDIVARASEAAAEVAEG
ncbi:glutamate-1-semialdehyde 2,1-aminomutase [Acidimicrobiia bacterium EGI L10123]|uniref:glutamate-1-semialdehyde 2,1-aminomutase n=1 Tax=Salinilacustrithrix flava TaxID=2957203 RepID=UPI003D7C2B22|nr:glutamate-1-semialdehyde 2,1-aminomutase [Acidimicrobiia bacterium EGI L10123]